MTVAEMLRQHLSSAEVNGEHTEAVLHLDDGSRLCFCHRVDERWAKALGSSNAPTTSGIASEIVAAIQMFRLNRKHLDILFQDESRWDEPLH